MKLTYIVNILLLFTFIMACSSEYEHRSVKDEFGTTIYYMDKDSLIQGELIRLDTEGDTVEVTQYKDDKLHGERKIYSNNKIEIIEHYRMDTIHGDYTTYYPNGQVNVKTVYKDGVINDMLYKYYDTGVLKEEVTIRDNLEDGPFKEYSPSGNIKWEGQYKGGDAEHGLLLKYNEEGQVIEKLICGLYQGETACQKIWDINVGDIPQKLPFDE